jgi:hypothetical protein
MEHLNKVLLAGRLTRDPEMRALASGKHVTQFRRPVSQLGVVGGRLLGGVASSFGIEGGSPGPRLIVKPVKRME